MITYQITALVTIEEGTNSLNCDDLILAVKEALTPEADDTGIKTVIVSGITESTTIVGRTI